MAGGRVDKEWLSSTRPGGDACIVQLRGHPPRAVWKARGSELHRGSRAVLVFVRGSRRAGAGAPPPVCACSSGTDGFHAYGERCRASTTTSTPTQPLSSTSTPFVTTATANASVWTGRWNVCRYRSVLSRFVENGKTKRLSPITAPPLCSLQYATVMGP
jgi:hypothetical protein